MKKRIVGLCMLVILFSLFTACNKETVIKENINTNVISGSATKITKEEKYEFIEEPVEYDLIAWEAFEETMTTEEYEAFKEYMPILEEKKVIHWVDGEGQMFQGEGFIKESFANFFEEDDEKISLKVTYIRIFDLNGDGKRELVISTMYGGPAYVIVYKEEDNYYGIALARRWFEEFYKDGSFSVAKGTGMRKFDFEKERYIIEKIPNKTDKTPVKKYYPAEYVEEK